MSAKNINLYSMILCLYSR